MSRAAEAPGKRCVQVAATGAQERRPRDLQVLERSLEKTRAALDMVGDAVVFFIPPGLRLVDVNRAACVSLGYSQSELLTMRLSDIAPQAGHGQVAAAIEKVVRGDVLRARILTVHRHKNGAEFPVESCLSRLDTGPYGSLVTVARDIRDRKRLEDLALHEAFRDRLTGLPNRAWLQSRLELAVDRARRDEYCFAVFFVDVDRFKRVNDSLGHLVGDRVLRAVAQRLLDSVRPVDVVARYGGDEFVVLMEDVRGEQDVIQIARRISRLVRTSGEPGRLNGQQIKITASIGIAINSNRYKSADELVHQADRAMYRAKALGRDGCWVLDTSTGDA